VSAGIRSTNIGGRRHLGAQTSGGRRHLGAPLILACPVPQLASFFSEGILGAPLILACPVPRLASLFSEDLSIRSANIRRPLHQERKHQKTPSLGTPLILACPVPQPFQRIPTSLKNVCTPKLFLLKVCTAPAPVFRPGAQSCFDRIVFDISYSIGVVFLIADVTIKRFPLPELAFSL